MAESKIEARREIVSNRQSLTNHLILIRFRGQVW